MEEISLKELIQILLKGKFLIIIFTVVFTVAGFAVSFLLPRSYTATLTLMVNSINSGKSAEITSLNSLLNAMNDATPQASIATYKEQITNNNVMLAVCEKLNAELSDDEKFTTDSLRRAITVETINTTSLLIIKAKSGDAELAAKMANTVGSVFINFISDKNREAAEIVSETIQANLDIEALKLDAEAKRLRDYLTNSTNIDALKGEITVLTSQIAGYKSSLNDVRRDIVVTNNTLETLLSDWTASSSLGDVAVNYNVSQASPEIKLDLENENVLRDVLLTIETTNLNTNLIRYHESEKALEEKIAEFETRLSELQATLADESYKYNSIQRDYALAEQTYSAYQTKYKEAVVAAVSDVGQATIQISSDAITPMQPEGTSKMVVISVAAILGMMVSVFVVFFIEYWKTADDYKVTAETNSVA